MADAKETKESTRDIEDLSKLNKQQLQLIAYVVTLIVVAAVLVTLILSFHYRRSSDATSVLSVIAPIFTALIGVVLGGGAGIAAGSAGKRAVRGELNVANGRLDRAKTKMRSVEALYQPLAAKLQTNLDSRSGSEELSYVAGDRTHSVVKLKELDEINSQLSELKGILE
jgi:hypothetical protein